MKDKHRQEHYLWGNNRDWEAISMKKLVILGHGTGGAIIAAKMRQKLPEKEWQITVIDRDWQHHYQPGWLLIPFGIYTLDDCVKPKSRFVPPGVNFVLDEIAGIDPIKKQVRTKRDIYPYDWLVVGTGCRIVPEEVNGLTTGWGHDIHNFYTAEGAVALFEKLKYFDKGRVVLNIAEVPFKCPVAPLEFVFMADWYFTINGVRDKVEVELVTPLPGAFTKPMASQILGQICEQKNIKVTPTNWLRWIRRKRLSSRIRVRRYLMISWSPFRPTSGPSVSSTAKWGTPWGMSKPIILR